MGGLLILLLAGMSSLYDFRPALKSALDWIDSLGPWGPLVFILIYVAATIGFVPGFILTLGAGFLFGLAPGTIYVSIASTGGATLAFLLGRYVARDWVAQKLKGREKFEAIDRAVGREGWKIVGLTRLTPLLPFNPLNYAYGLTHVRLRDFFIASWIGMLPGTLMYVYLGTLVSELASLGAAGRESTTGEKIFYAAGFVFTVIVVVYVTRLARKALKKEVGEKVVED